MLNRRQSARCWPPTQRPRLSPPTGSTSSIRRLPAGDVIGQATGIILEGFDLDAVRGRSKSSHESPDVQILVATDAAGEGLNLQAAHLMVNYDLPWNPNRIEQRFGRIHRIGQTEVCQLWNIVADNTREGEVFRRLLDKIEEQRVAYGGKVFDVLGTSLGNVKLADLLRDAIRYGERREVRQQMHEIIDKGVVEGLRELMDDYALAHEVMPPQDLEKLRAEMEE